MINWCDMLLDNTMIVTRDGAARWDNPTYNYLQLLIPGSSRYVQLLPIKGLFGGN